MSKVITVFFSPSETTKKVVSQIANNFEEESVICDLLYFNDEKEFASDDIVIVGMPVFERHGIASGTKKRTCLFGAKHRGRSVKALSAAHGHFSLCDGCGGGLLLRREFDRCLLWFWLWRPFEEYPIPAGIYEMSLQCYDRGISPSVDALENDGMFWSCGAVLCVGRVFECADGVSVFRAAHCWRVAGGAFHPADLFLEYPPVRKSLYADPLRRVL